MDMFLNNELDKTSQKINKPTQTTQPPLGKHSPFTALLVVAIKAINLHFLERTLRVNTVRLHLAMCSVFKDTVLQLWVHSQERRISFLPRHADPSPNHGGQYGAC